MAVCDVEFTLPKPSLTLRTLDVLQAKYPSRRFALLVGTDIVGEFGRWYRSGEILTASRFWSIRAGRSRTAFPTNASRF
ncbi:MAG: hypothetical protein ACLR76_01365 [Alistipes sp.]